MQRVGFQAHETAYGQGVDAVIPTGNFKELIATGTRSHGGAGRLPVTSPERRADERW